MYLGRKDLYKLVQLLQDFPKVDTFEIDQSNHSGIGRTTTVSFEQETNGHKGQFTIEISGVEDW